MNRRAVPAAVRAVVPAVLAVGLAGAGSGCTGGSAGQHAASATDGSGSASRSPSPSHPVVTTLSTPPVAHGEVGRVIYPGKGNSVSGDSEAIPGQGSYLLRAACVTRPGYPTVIATVQVLDAGIPVGSAADRTLVRTTVSCTGEETLDGLPPLPHHPIQVALDVATDAVSHAYAVVEPN